MNENPYNIKTTYYKRGQQVCAVSTGAKQKLPHHNVTTKGSVADGI